MFARIIGARPALFRRAGLAAILLVAFALRVWNLDWDDGTHQHPDERYWSIVTSDISWEGPADYFSSDSELNPYTDRSTWVYGTLPLFATKAVAGFLADGPFPAGAIVTLADSVGIDLRNDRFDSEGRPARVDAFDDGYNANLVGRLLSAIADTATVGVVYLLGRRLFNRRVGMLAALLSAFTVLQIQYSHFYGAESWATLFVTAAVLASVELLAALRGDARPGGPASSPATRRVLLVAAATGVLLGMAAASKLNAAAALVVPTVAIIIAAGPAIRTLLGTLDRSTITMSIATTIGLTTLGIALGLSTSAVAAIMFLSGLSVPLLIAVTFSDLHDARLRRAGRALKVSALSGLSVLLAGAVTFRILQPYAFDGIVSLDARFVADLDYLEGVNSGGNVPWVVQWVGRTALLYPLKSALATGLGPALGVAVASGMALAGYRIVRSRQWELLLPLALIAAMLGLVGQQFNPVNRYLLPAYPTAVVLAAYAVAECWRAGSRSALGRPATSAAMRLTAAVAVALSLLWGVAFVNGVYGEQHPRITASEWIFENIEPGSVLTHQTWDDRLPLAIEGARAGPYGYVELDLFSPDVSFGAVSKVDLMLDGLDQADYVIEASNRLYDSIPRVPARYPATTAYYEALFDGSLGFEKIASFSSSPSLFGIRIDDSGAEETFTVYDHPTVTIWQKTDSFTLNRAEEILNPQRAQTAVVLYPNEAATNALLLRPDRTESILDGPTFNETFDEDGLIAAAPWLWWVVWLQLAALAVLPWSTIICWRAGSASWGLSKVLAFLLVGLTAWFATAMGLMEFGGRLAWLSWSAVLALGAFGWWTGRARIAALWRRHRAVWIASEIVFLAAGAASLVLRSLNPDLWESYLGGEKPMDLAYLTAVSRSEALPPYDPWFAGGVLNYYYLGWFLLAVPIRALRILPEVGFQLGVATYAGLAAVTVFSAVCALVSSATSDRARPATPRAVIATGVFGVTSLLLVGNLGALRQHYSRLASVNGWGDAAGIPVLGQIVTFLGGSWAWIRGAQLEPFDWWAPSRINTDNIDITEFPNFTVLFGDLHPHLMDITVFGLLASLTVAYLTSCRFGDRRRSAALAGLMGAVSGIMRAINTWDLPAALILVAGTVLVGKIVEPPPSDSSGDSGRAAGSAALIATLGLAAGSSLAVAPGGPLTAGMGSLIGIGCAAAGLVGAAALILPDRARRRVLGLLGHAAFAAVAHILVSWPFTSNNETSETSLQSAQDRSPLDDYLTHWGIFFGLATALFTALVVDERRRVMAGAEPAGILPLRLRQGSQARLAISVVAIGWILLAVTNVNGAFAIAGGGAFVGAGLMAREVARPERDVGRIAALGLLSLGFAIAAGPEVVTVDPDIVRMNTVFKFWLQAWHLFAIGGAFAAWQVARVLSDSPQSRVQRHASSTRIPGHRHVSPARLWGATIAVATCAGLTYPLLATGPRLAARFADISPTLDGLAYLDHDPSILRKDKGFSGPEVTVELADDLPLIEWIREHVRGTPTIAEWPGPIYDWTARVATHTGIPTVIGWDWHQTQQRGDFSGLIQDRKRAIESLYTIPDAELTSDVIKAYGIELVVVGTMEQRFGDPDALTALSAHPALVEVFRSGANVIYEVDPVALWTTSGASSAVSTPG